MLLQKRLVRRLLMPQVIGVVKSCSRRKGIESNLVEWSRIASRYPTATRFCGDRLAHTEISPSGRRTNSNRLLPNNTVAGVAWPDDRMVVSKAATSRPRHPRAMIQNVRGDMVPVHTVRRHRYREHVQIFRITAYPFPVNTAVWQKGISLPPPVSSSGS